MMGSGIPSSHNKMPFPISASSARRLDRRFGRVTYCLSRKFPVIGVTAERPSLQRSTWMPCLCIVRHQHDTRLDFQNALSGSKPAIPRPEISLAQI